MGMILKRLMMLPAFAILFLVGASLAQETPVLLETGQFKMVINDAFEAAVEDYRLEQLENKQIRVTSQGVVESLDRLPPELSFLRAEVILQGPFSEELLLTEEWEFRRYSARFTTVTGGTLEIESEFDGILLRTAARQGDQTATVSRIIEGDLILDPRGTLVFPLILVKRLEHRGQSAPWTVFSFSPLGFRFPPQQLEIRKIEGVILKTEEGSLPAERYRIFESGSAIQVETDLLVREGNMVGLFVFSDEPDPNPDLKVLVFRSDLFPKGFQVQESASGS